MYDVLSPHPDNRRLAPRLRLQVVLNEYVWERPYRALATDVSEAGLAIQKRTEAAVPFPKVVALEVMLPGTNETIWASAEPRFDAIGGDVHVSGLRFVSMARKHERLIRDYLHERRERLLRLFYPASRPVSRFPASRPVSRFPVSQPTGPFPVSQPAGPFPVSQPAGRFPVS
jgi:hypothetical protein